MKVLAQKYIKFNNYFVFKVTWSAACFQKEYFYD